MLVAEEILDYAVRLLMMTHPEEAAAPEAVRKYVQFGSGPRGIQSIISVSKVRALCAGGCMYRQGIFAPWLYLRRATVCS